MLTRYKEIFYGLLFGLGASMIDVSMHASMEQQGFLTELFRPQLAMAAYRGAFIVFGLALGWLLWRKNRVEREFRSLTETLGNLCREITAPAMIIHTQAQLLLTRTHPAIPTEAESAVRSIYEQSARLQSLAKPTVVHR